MSTTATVKVLSPEEITARAGMEVPFLVWPNRSTVFAERAMRFQQLATHHAMGDFLQFMGVIALAQQEALKTMPSVLLPGVAEIDKAARLGLPPLPATDWARDPAWHGILKSLVSAVLPKAPLAARPALEALSSATPESLERQADALLHGVMAGVDLAAAPLVAAALQVLWTRMVLDVQERHGPGGQPFGRIDDATVCPCCGSRPTVSFTRTAGDTQGQRYLHCSLCSTEWHMVRAKCSHCGSTTKVAYQSLDVADSSEEEGAQRAAKAAVQAETCEDCGHYLKVIHHDRDPMVEPVADDLASITLDLLVSESGWRRHGVNLLLLFGDPGEPENESATASPPEPLGAD